MKNTLNSAENRAKYLDWGIFSAVLFMLLFFLARYTIYTLDADASSELVLAKHLADMGGSIMSKNWYYSTEIKFLCDQLAFELMFFFTDNWRIVRFGGTLILIAILLVCYYHFCRELDIKSGFPLLAAITLLPLSDIYFNIIYKFAYYIQYLFTGYIALYAVFRFAGTPGKKRYISFALALLLSLAAGILGFRLILTIYAPLMLAVLSFLWADRSSAESRKQLIGSAVLTAAALAGMVLNQLVIAPNYSFHDYTTISFTGFSLTGIENMITGALSILGFRSGASVFSAELLPTALSGILLLLSFFSAWYILRRRESFSPAQQTAAWFYVWSMAVLCLLYCFTDMGYYTYHSIQAVLHGLPLIFICFGKKDSFGRLGRPLLLGITCFALLCGALHYNDMRKVDKTRALREASAFLAESDYDQGYASFWIGNLATELANGEIDVWVWDDLDLMTIKDPDQIVPWLQSKDHDDPPAKGKVFVLLTANEAYYAPFAQAFSEDDIIYRTENYYEAASDEFVIFGFDSYEDMRAKFLSAFQ